MDDTAGQRAVAHQIQQRLEMLTARNYPTGQRLARNIDAVATQYLFKSVKRQAVHIFGGQQHRQNARAGHAFFNQLSWLVRSDRSGLAVAAAVDFADVSNDADLHRHDFKLLADFLANGVFVAAADAGQFVRGQFVDDFDAWQVSGQRLAFTATFGGSNDLFFNVFVDSFGDVFGFIEKGQCGVAGSAVCSDLRPNNRWRSSAFSSSRKPTRDCIFASICLSS